MSIRILDNNFYNSLQTKDNLFRLTANQETNTIRSVSYYSIFYNTNFQHNVGFASCNETASSRNDVNLLLIYFPKIQEETNNSIKERTLFLLPRLVELFDELAKYTNAKNKPIIEMVSCSKQHCPFVLFDFSECLEWVNSRTQRLMLLKLIRSFSTSFENNIEPDWFRNEKKEINLERLISRIFSNPLSQLLNLYKHYFLITNSVMQLETSF